MNTAGAAGFNIGTLTGAPVTITPRTNCSVVVTYENGGALLSAAEAFAFGLTLAILLTNCFGYMSSESPRARQYRERQVRIMQASRSAASSVKLTAVPPPVATATAIAEPVDSGYQAQTGTWANVDEQKV